MQDPYQEQTNKIYNDWALVFKEKTQNLEDFWWMLETFKSFMISWKILDIGCAYGRHMKLMQEYWFDVYWVEISERLIELAEANIKKKITVWSMLDIEKIYPPREFTGIISSASIVHMDKSLWISVLKSTYRLLQANWFLYLAFLILPEESSPDTRIKSSKTIPWINKKYVYYSEGEMDSILKDIWFIIKKEFIHCPHNDIWKTIIAQKI